MQVIVVCDKYIVDMLKNRNRQALVIVLEKYGKELYSFVYHCLNSKELVGTTLKKTFSAVWDASKNYNKSSEHFFIWLLRITQQTVNKVRYS